MTLPTLWLYGTSGVGKTTTAWELFRELPGPVGFVDIDQIGMFYGPPTAENWAPEPACDLGRHRMKARNLNAVAANFRAFGAACLIVPGIADETLGPAIAVLPNVALTAVRLRADRADLAKRIAARGRPNDELEPIAEYADALDRLPGPCVDTTGLDVPSVVSRVRAAIGSWPGPAVPGPAVPGRVPATCDQPGDILWLCGPTAIGKSSVAWQAYQQLMRAGTRTAYIDLDQVGFRRPATAGNHRLKAANLASLWQTYAGEGARRLVMAGPATAEAVDIYRSALPSARLSICRLRATPATLSSRVHARGRGDSPAAGLAGDLLAGASVATLNRIAAEAISDAAELERAGVGDFALDTDDRTPADLATEILDRVSASAPD
jgi:chloramphenicol 3-O-phosphotransferase